MFPAIVKTVLRYSKFRFETKEHFAVDRSVIQKLRSLPYLEQWRTARESAWFHIALEDHALFMFETAAEPSYHYLECPLDVPTLTDYVASTNRQPKARYDASVLEEYEAVLLTAATKSYVCPMRYDYDSEGYRPGVHPVAHLHIGIDNEIRLGLRREMNPLAFLLLVIRQRYPTNWEILIRSSLRARLSQYVRDLLPIVAANFYCEADRAELYFE